MVRLAYLAGSRCVSSDRSLHSLHVETLSIDDPKLQRSFEQVATASHVRNQMAIFMIVTKKGFQKYVQDDAMHMPLIRNAWWNQNHADPSPYMHEIYQKVLLFSLLSLAKRFLYPHFSFRLESSFSKAFDRSGKIGAARAIKCCWVSGIDSLGVISHVHIPYISTMERARDPLVGGGCRLLKY